MAEQEQLGIEVVAEVQDALDKLQDLLTGITNIPDSATTEIDVVVNDEAMTNIESELASIPDEQVEVDVVAKGAEEAKDDLSGVANEAEDVGAGGAIAGAGLAAGVGAMVMSAGSYSDQMTRIGTAQDGVVSSVADVQNKWGSTMSQMSSDTGRSGSTIRKTLADMGVVGIHSTDTITEGFKLMSGAAYNTGKPIEAVEQAYTRAVQTGLLGSRQLRSLGIDTDTVFAKTGMTMEQVNAKMKTMTSEQRAAFLNMLMDTDKNRAGVEAYKTSWEHATELIGRGLEYISRVLGATLLPIATVVLGGVVWLLSGIASAIDNLNGPVGSAVKVIIGLGLAFAFVVGAVATLQFAYTKLEISQILQNARTILQTAYNWTLTASQYALAAAQWLYNVAVTAAILASNGMLLAVIRQTAANWLENASRAGGILSLGVMAAAYIASGIASGIATIATGAMTIAQWALNVALSANPIGIVVIAIAALVAALIYVFTQTEWGRNIIKGFWTELNVLWTVMTTVGSWITGTWNKIWEGAGKAVDMVRGFFINLGTYLAELPGNMYKWGTDIILGLINGIVNAIPGLRQALSAIGINFPQSPPKEGPLAAITEAGAESWTSGIAGAMSRGLNKFGLNNLKLPNLSTSSNAMSSNQSSSQPINITVDLTGLPAGTTPEQAKSVGNNIGDASADRIHTQLISKGYSAINRSR
jgi:hypothetical protein